MPRLARHLLAALALGLAAVWAYLPALHGEFQFDDAMGIERGGWYLKGDSVPERLEGLLHTASLWGGRGLVTATYQLNFWMAGGNDLRFMELNAITAPFHAFSIAVHVLGTWGLYALLAWAGRKATPGVLPALLGAALFALHPLATESVAYISARTGAMAACFTFWGTFGFLALGAPRDGVSRPLLSRALACLALGAGGFLAIGCKETGWMAPPMALAALAWDYRTGGGRFWRDWGWILAGAGALFLAGIAAWAGGRSMLSVDFFRQYSQIYDLPQTRAVDAHLMTQLHAWWSFHAPRFVLPFGFWHPTVDPDPAILKAAPGGLGWLLGLEAAAVLGLAALAWRSWRRRTMAGLGLMWILLGVIPVSAVALLDVTAERHAYVPLAGAALALAFPLSGFLRRSRPAAGATALALLCLLALTRDRVGDWRTEPALWREAIRDAPRKPRPYYNMAKSLARTYRLQDQGGDPDAARRTATRTDILLRLSLRCSPTFHLAHGARARGLDFLGRDAEAVDEYRMALICHAASLKGGEAPAVHAGQLAVLTKALAACLRRLGREAEAGEAFHWAVGYHVEALREGRPPSLHAPQAVLLIRDHARFLREGGRAADARQVLRDGLALFPRQPQLQEALDGESR